MACQQPQAHPARCGCEQESPANELALLRLGYGNACRERDALQQRLNNLETVQQASLERSGRIKAAAGALGWTAEREDGPLEFLIQQAQRSRELELQRDAATQANTRFAAEHCALVGERDDLRAGVERLREALRRIHVRAEAHVEHGRGMPDGSTFVVEDIARTALERSAWAVDTSGATQGA